MPVFMFARIDSNQVTYYPESATVIGSDPLRMNPGTDPVFTINPGEDCKDPQPNNGYQGDSSWGQSFPIYVDAIFCESDTTWRINYLIHFVHDLLHKHDWEHVTVIWSKSPTGQDWYYRSHVIYSTHKTREGFKYEDVITVNLDGEGDIADTALGAGRRHPKAFVGMYEHALYPDRKVSCLGGGCSGNADEYRSTDWWYKPALKDIHWGTKEIKPEWFDGTDADGHPQKKLDAACGWAKTG